MSGFSIVAVRAAVLAAASNASLPPELFDKVKRSAGGEIVHVTAYAGMPTMSVSAVQTRAVEGGGVASYFVGLNVLGGTTLSNGLSVSGNEIVAGTSYVSGAATFSNAVTATGTLTALGASTLSNGLTVFGGTTTLSNALTLSGNAIVVGTSYVSGAATFSNTVLMSSNLTTAGDAKLTGTITGGTDMFLMASSNGWPSAPAGRSLYMRYSTAGGQDQAYVQSIDRATSVGYPLRLLSSNLFIDTTTASMHAFLANGNVGIGTTAPAYKLDVVGDVIVSGVIRTTNTINNKQLVLWDGNAAEVVATASNFYGFGINGGALRYQVPGPAAQHKWYTGATSTMTLDGTGSLTCSSNITCASLTTGNGNVSVGTGAVVLREVSVYCGFSATNNRQLWISDNTLPANSTNTALRFLISGTSAPIVDAVSTDGGTQRQLQLGSSAAGVTIPGNVGIGTTSPVFKLHSAGSVFVGDITYASTTIPTSGVVPGVGTANNIRLVFDNSYNPAGGGLAANKIVLHNTSGFLAGFGIENVGVTYHSGVNHNFYVSTTGTSYGTLGLTVTPSGVGIGTASPAFKLDVVGGATSVSSGANGLPATTGGTQTTALALRVRGSDNGVLDFGVNSGGNGAWLQSTDRSAHNASYPLLLNPNGGNVGIGTSSPAYKLDVNGQLRVNENGIFNALSIGNVSQSSYMGIVANSSNAFSFVYNYMWNTAIYTANPALYSGIFKFDATTSVFSFQSSPSKASFNPAMNQTLTITSSNVGIGTSSPAYKLDVAGKTMLNANVNGNPATSGTTQTALALRVKGGDGVALDMGVNSGNGAWLQCMDINNLALNFPMVLNPNGGNVGIGNNNPQYTLDVTGNARASTSMTIGSTNFYTDPSTFGGIRISGPYQNGWSGINVENQIYMMTGTDGNGGIWSRLTGDWLVLASWGGAKYALTSGSSSSCSGNAASASSTPQLVIGARSLVSASGQYGQWSTSGGNPQNTWNGYAIEQNFMYFMARTNGEGGIYNGSANNRWIIHGFADNTTTLDGALVRVSEALTVGTTLTTGGDISSSTEIYAQNWFRSRQSGTGWYHQVHEGGWYMNDNNTVKVVNNKNIYTAGGIDCGGALTCGNFTPSGRIVIQNSQNGGASKGIYLWNAGDTAWGIYMATSGGGVSLANGTAVAGYGFANEAVRFRCHAATVYGFIFENSSEQLLLSIRGDGLANFSGEVRCPTLTVTGAVSGASASFSGQVTCTTLQVNAEAYCSSWFRSRNWSTGWYHELGGGGWHMQDTTYVRCTSDKSIYTGGTVQVGGYVLSPGGNWSGNCSGSSGGLTGSPNITVSALTAAYLAANYIVGSSGKVNILSYWGQDANYGIGLFTNGADGSSGLGGTGNQYQGGLESWFGIGFRCKTDGVTRFLHNARTGDTSMSGNLTVQNNVDCSTLTAKGKIVCISSSGANGASYAAGINFTVNNEQNAVICGDVSGLTGFTMGIDRSDSKFKLKMGSGRANGVFDSTPQLIVDESGNLTSGAITCTSIAFKSFPSVTLTEAWGIRMTGASQQPLYVINASFLVGYYGNGTDYGTNNLLVAGRVGIGNTSPQYPLHITTNGYGTVDGGYYFSTGTSAITSFGQGGQNISIYAECYILSRYGFLASSDSRIKENITVISTNLSVIDNINVVSYQYKDKVLNGKATKIGYIAQEVHEHLPDAVSKRTDWVPDIFRPSSAVDTENKRITLANHQLTIDTVIKLVNQAGDATGFSARVSEIIDADTFSVLCTESVDAQVFVYGRQVDDFHDLDYDMLSAVAFGGVKELHAKYKELQCETTSLSVELQEQKMINVSLQSRLAALEELVSKLR